MRITPPEPEIPEVGGFTDTNDIFSYRDFGNRLANLVHNIDQSLVIALDGQWGSGKSVFIKQWAGLLRERGAPVIYFDAFQNDHQEDAFLTLSAEIYATAKEMLGGNERTTRRYFGKAKKAASILTPIALQIAARAGTAGLLSYDDIEEGSDALNAAVKAFGDETGKAIQNAVSERLRSSHEERAVLDAFRETLASVAQEMATHQMVICDDEYKDSRPYPLVFIVDELDRCRPPFALNVVERIKHLFSVEGVCFVLVTHLPQLESAILGQYGSSFDAHEYLEKFYQLRIGLPPDKREPAKHRNSYIKHLWKALGIRFEEERQEELLLEHIAVLAQVYELPLRRLERVVSHIVLVAASVGPNYLVLAPLLAGLCVMRQTHPDLYRQAAAGNLTWPLAERFLFNVPPGQDRPSSITNPAVKELQENEWATDWWRYATNDLNFQDSRHDADLLRFGGLSRGDLIPLMASYIDDLVSPDEP